MIMWKLEDESHKLFKSLEIELDKRWFRSNESSGLDKLFDFNETDYIKYNDIFKKKINGNLPIHIILNLLIKEGKDDIMRRSFTPQAVFFNDNNKTNKCLLCLNYIINAYPDCVNVPDVNGVLSIDLYENDLRKFLIKKSDDNVSQQTEKRGVIKSTDNDEVNEVSEVREVGEASEEIEASEVSEVSQVSEVSEVIEMSAGE
eukprot:GHVN01100728.1.p1 GENE.GHVN01100728.1~~GHVN01100728.1.p1  ORF type:complete len:202 (-),score=75.02 GHVN01100728.1:27-632(-)